MANSVTHLLPYPIANARFSLPLSFRIAAGTPTDPTTPDTEFSTDGGATFTDCAEEITTGGANGMGYLTLTGAETNNRMLLIAAKSANCVTTPAIIHPRTLAIVGSGTLSVGSSGGGTLGTLLIYDVTGCFLRTTGGTGGGGTGGANNQARRILTYNTTTGAFTVSAWETTPDATTTYDVLLPEGVTLGMLRALNPATPGRTAVVDLNGLIDANAVKVGPTGSGTPQTARDLGQGIPNAVPGAANGLLIAGSNAATTFAGLTTGALSCTTLTASGAVAFQSTFTVTTSTALGAISGSTLTMSGAVAFQSTFIVSGATTLTGNVALAAGLTVTQSSSNTAGISVTGNGTGAGILVTGGATGSGITAAGGGTSGDGLRLSATSGHGIDSTGGTAGSGINSIGGASGAGISAVGGSASGTGFSATASAGNNNGIEGTGFGSGSGIKGSGGATGIGMQAFGAFCGLRITGSSLSSGGFGLQITGSGTGHGITVVASGTGNGINIAGGGTSGIGIAVTTTAGDGISILPTAGHAIVATANGTSKHGMFVTGGTAGTSDGVKSVAGTGGVGFRTDSLTVSGAIAGTSASNDLDTIYGKLPANGIADETLVLAAIASVQVDTNDIQANLPNGLTDDGFIKADIASIQTSLTHAGYLHDIAGQTRGVALMNGAITDATITAPAEASGRPTTILGMIRRMFEWASNKRTRDRNTGIVLLRNSADSGTLETQTQSTVSTTDAISKGV